MAQHHEITIAGEELWLMSDKALYWPDQKCLFLADLHLGKAGHFRKHGVPVPGMLMQQDLKRLEALLQSCETEVLIMLGDLFHSHHNQEVDQFGAWLANQALPCRLIQGNHDIMAADRYPDLGIEVYPEGLQMGPFELRHHPLQYPEEAGGYVLAGHLHPGVRLLGLGRQALTLPCFHFTPYQGLLPAFGTFTGLAIIEPAAEDQVFALADGEIMPV